jgi:hypothetical protein
MDEQEWGPLAARIDNWWGEPEFDDVKAAAYFEQLEPYPGELVERAWRELLEEGSRFTPSLAEVKKKIGDIDEPSLRFDVMWVAVRAALVSEEPLRFLEPEHPLYLQFFREQGGRAVLCNVDPNSSYRMHQLGTAWKELVAEYRAGKVKRAALAGAVRPLLGSGKKASGLRKLDGGKSLPAKAGE